MKLKGTTREAVASRSRAAPPGVNCRGRRRFDARCAAGIGGGTGQALEMRQSDGSNERGDLMAQAERARRPSVMAPRGGGAAHSERDGKCVRDGDVWPCTAAMAAGVLPEQRAGDDRG